MQKNVGSADKTVRILLGLGLLSLLFVLEAPMKYLGLIGIVPLATSLMGWCPLYTLLGVNTCRVKS
ncbi:MAG: YgaP family membrane protein [Pseudomonadota bacterium]